jgi:hypothetical protein
MYFSDAFTKPCRFEPDVVVDIEAEFDRLVGMLHCHQSQFYEWLPYNAGYLDQVPAGELERRRWLAERIGRRIRPLADRYRDLLVQTYGPQRGGQVKYIEAFEVSEYGAPFDPATQARLFPFLPAGSPSGSAFVAKRWVDIPEEE